MPEKVITSNKRIAKNTLLLYLRMFYSLLISLFTARVLLHSLGFTDYGLYNVVGSVTTMFTFLRSAMGNATNRYIAFGVGKGSAEELKKTFSTCVIVHAIIALLIIVLCEVVGLWLFYNNSVLQIFTAIGFFVWIVLLVFAIDISDNNRTGIITIVPILSILLSLLISAPVFSEFRYMYALFCALPIIIAVSLRNRNREG